VPVAERPQHMRALESANEIRLGRAQFKRELKAGEVCLTEVLKTEIPFHLDSMLLEDLLRAVPRLNKPTAHKLLHKLPVGLTRTVGELTDRQRYKLAGLLAGWESKLPPRSEP
jgi:hypothetical protein